jgi:hypothetical protein
MEAPARAKLFVFCAVVVLAVFSILLVATLG